MLKLSKKEEINMISKYPKKVVENVDNIINILNENYGYNRTLTDNGGYVCIIEDIEEVNYLKEKILKGIVEEFSDVIYESENVTYSSTLYLLSSDYSVTVISKNEQTKYLLK